MKFILTDEECALELSFEVDKQELVEHLLLLKGEEEIESVYQDILEIYGREGELPEEGFNRAFNSLTIKINDKIN